MTDPSHDRASRIAELLGVVQEARRLGHRVAGSEHLLMATFADPVVRQALSGVGCDLRQVQTEVTRTGGARREPAAATGVTLTPQAVDLITRATADYPDIDLDQRPHPRLTSTLLGTVMITLLRDEQDTAAARLLDGLGVRGHSRRLVAAIERNAGPAVLPRHE